MEKCKALLKKYEQFIKFGLVGVTNTIISYGTYSLLVLLGVQYLIANLIGFVISVLNSYYWNNKYVFEKTSQGHGKALSKTFMAYGMTLLLSTGLLFVMVQNLGVPKILAPLPVLLVTIPINYLMNKFWAFK